MTRAYESLKDSVACGIIIPHRDVGPEAILTQKKGTISFIETPERRLIITCAHVWDEFLAERAMNNQCHLLAIGADEYESFLLTDAREIDKEVKNLDVVSLDLPLGAERVEQGGKRFFRAVDWPPPFVQADDTVIGLGYPGEHQKPDVAETQRVGKPVVQLRPTTLTLTVSSSSTRHFVLAENTDDNPRRGISFDATLEELKSLGGASGAAYYRYTAEGLTFAGIQYEARGETAVEAAILVSHGAYFKADGTIDRSRLPHT